MTDATPPLPALRVVGLFAGIGGIEVGLHRAGHTTLCLCEIEPGARAVLRARFPDLPLYEDVRELTSLPDAELVVAGFPCQDLSQAGQTAGIAGKSSGLVDQVFRLLSRSGAGPGPRWLLLENVPFMLQLDRGRAMRYLTDVLAQLGFTWAYRTVDTRAFGLPQRRQRVLLLASRTEDPRGVLLVDEAGPPVPLFAQGLACGFYWTEGTRGLGWAVDAVPTLKGGSTIGIPSAPAIWTPAGEIVTPDIRDAERLQGFSPDWTLPAVADAGIRKGARWKLVGNAVSTPVAAWVGGRLRDPCSYDGSGDPPLFPEARWPKAAWGANGKAYRADVSEWPVHVPHPHLLEFLHFPTTPLSERATAGFLQRARSGGLRFVAGFLEDVAAHLERMRSSGATGGRGQASDDVPPP